MDSSAADIVSWTSAERDALCCEVTLLADLIKRGAVSFSNPGDFYSTVSSNLLARHSISRSANAIRMKWKKIRDECVAAGDAVDERKLLGDNVAVNTPLYPGQPAPAPLLPHTYSEVEQVAVLRWQAIVGVENAGSLNMAVHSDKSTDMAGALPTVEEAGQQPQQQQQQQQQPSSFTLPYHGPAK